MGKDELESALYWLPWIKSGKFWAGVLVVFGIAGELLGDRLAEPLDATIEKARQTEIVQLRKDTAEANARAAEANLELWNLRTPRALSDPQRQLLVANLKIIGKYRVDVYSLIPHDESLALQTQLVSVFSEAGWTAYSNPNRRIPQPGIVNGLVIEIAAGASTEIRTVAGLVASELRKAGLLTSGPQASQTMGGDAPIEILVGPKP